MNQVSSLELLESSSSSSIYEVRVSRHREINIGVGRFGQINGVAVEVCHHGGQEFIGEASLKEWIGDVEVFGLP